MAKISGSSARITITDEYGNEIDLTSMYRGETAYGGDVNLSSDIPREDLKKYLKPVTVVITGFFTLEKDNVWWRGWIQMQRTIDAMKRYFGRN